MNRPPKAAICALVAILLAGLALVSSSSATRARTTNARAAVHNVAGGTLKVGAAQGIPQLNPAIWTFAWEETLLPLLWDALTQYNADGSVGPDLATSWTPANGGRQWTFHLRPGIKFSNGAPFTSADVVGNFKYYLKPTTTYHDKNQISLIKTITAAGPLTVVFKLSQPDAFLPQGVTNVKMIQLSALSTINKNPIGTGPFIVKSFVPNGPLTLVRNPNYRGPAASLDEIDFTNISDPTAAYTSLRSGNLDALWSVPYSDVPGIEGNPALKLVKPAIASQFVFWDIDNKHGAFSNVKARQALSYATNREAILKDAYFGQGVSSTANDPLATNNPAYDKSLTPYPYDLAKAKKLFAEAGVTKLTWWGVAGGQYPEFNTMGQILQASLKQIGIPMDIQNRDISTWAAKFYPAGKTFPGLVVPNFNPDPPQPEFLLNWFLPGVCDCNWNNPDYQKLYNQAVATTSKSAQQALFNRLQKMVNEQVPDLVPLQAEVVTAIRSTVTGAWAEGGGQLHLEDASLG